MILIATIVADDRRGVFFGADPRHVILIAIIVLDQGLCGFTGSSSDSSPTVSVAVIAADHGASALADANPSADVFIATVMCDRWAGIFMTDASVKVLEAGVL